MPQLSDTERSEWERLLAAAAELQTLLPDATLVGGTAAALYAGHRVSFDADHVLADLRERFDAVLARLEREAGWKTKRRVAPILILGSYQGVEQGIRQLMRRRPLETVVVTINGQTLRIPTVDEITRIKGLLVVRRNVVRDYLDVAALADRIGATRAAQILAGLDVFYEADGGAAASHLPVATQLMKQLAEPRPTDAHATNLRGFRGIEPSLATWEAVTERTRTIAAAMAAFVAGETLGCGREET